MVQGPGKLVARVCVDSLENTKYDPNIHGENVELSCNGAPQNGRTNGAESEDHYFNR